MTSQNALITAETCSLVSAVCTLSSMSRTTGYSNWYPWNDAGEKALPPALPRRGSGVTGTSMYRRQCRRPWHFSCSAQSKGLSGWRPCRSLHGSSQSRCRQPLPPSSRCWSDTWNVHATVRILLRPCTATVRCCCRSRRCGGCGRSCCCGRCCRSRGGGSCCLRCWCSSCHGRVCGSYRCAVGGDSGCRSGSSRGLFRCKDRRFQQCGIAERQKIASFGILYQLFR